MKKGISNKVKERVETIESMGIVDAAKQRYVVEQRSYRWLAKHWGVNQRTVARILSYCGIAIRHGSEAVATQWAGNLERRKQAGKKLAQTNHRLAMEGRHVRQGKTKSNSELIRHISEKLKTSTSFHRPDVRAQCVSNSIAFRHKHPERMSALRKPLSEAEKIMSGYLYAKGLPFEQKVLISPFYVADFFIPSLNLIIDCQGRNRFPLSYERHKSLAAEGRCVVYCVNEFVQRGVFTNLDDYITRLNLSRSNPSMRCEEAVIFGACGHRPFGDDTDQLLLNRFGVRANYYTVVSAATND